MPPTAASHLNLAQREPRPWDLDAENPHAESADSHDRTRPFPILRKSSVSRCAQCLSPHVLSSLATARPPTATLAPPIANDDRYSRQILFPGIGATGQHLLASAHVAIVGVGATGAAAASLLARAGVGTLTLIDRDFVEPSNLQRQILFDEADARESLPKAEAARRKIALFNSTITVHPHIADLVPANIHELLTPADLILDATDNFETRYLINDFGVQQSKPWIYAAAIGAYAATMNILPKS